MHRSSPGAAYALLAPCLLLLNHSAAIASETVLDRLAGSGVEIRKSFTGSSKDAGLPAAITYENPDQGSNFYAIDVGVKTGALLEDPFAAKNLSGLLFPTLELHHSTKAGERAKKIGGGLTMELERAVGTDASEDPFATMWFADAKIELLRDSIEDQTTRTATLRMGYYNVNSDYGPAKDILIGREGALSARWMLTGGVEDYRKLPIKTKVNGESVVVAEAIDTTVGFARMNVQIKPFRNALNKKLVLTGTYTLRSNLSGDDIYGDTTRLLEASLDWYLDEKDRLALGLSYQRGADPVRNFLDEEFSSLGLKLKLGP